METRAGDVGKVTKGMYVALITTGGQSLLFPVSELLLMCIIWLWRRMNNASIYSEIIWSGCALFEAHVDYSQNYSTVCSW